MNYTIQQALQWARAQLANYPETSAFESALLLAYALHQPREYLYAHPEALLTEIEWQTFQRYIARRVSREPIAYITGMREFWSHTLNVTPATLIPRPETEILVETALNLGTQLAHSCKVADLGTGSGAIALALASERPDWHLFAVDISADALLVAKKNAKVLGFSNISFYAGNWSTVLASIGAHPFDMIVSNPPYLTEAEWAAASDGLHFEPANALAAGEDGLAALREVITLAATSLLAGGYVVLEHGATQGFAVRALLTQAGFSAVKTVRDLAGLERVSVGLR